MIIYLEKKLKEHMRDEINDVVKYNMLSAILRPEDAKLVMRIAQDESKHIAYLAKIMLLLFGKQELYPFNATVNIGAKKTRDILLESIKEEEKAASEYTYLYIDLRARSTSYTVIFMLLDKIIRDEKRHAKILESIYKKYL